MDTAIIVSIITGVFTLVGTIIAVVAGNTSTKQQIRVQQAVMDTKLEALTEEVKKHNSFGERIPVIEKEIEMLSHRVDDLEKR